MFRTPYTTTTTPATKPLSLKPNPTSRRALGFSLLRLRDNTPKANKACPAPKLLSPTMNQTTWACCCAQTQPRNSYSGVLVCQRFRVGSGCMEFRVSGVDQSGV